ncbi:GDSL-like lipase/acylhydrolase [Candidatus Rhodobacter oscarellae]|uniref:GDSL-like lipase/acylhydrolase n=1 Tax=Candidatus Rhodobacter oscarellae TaxID=1675527 RepID=A0A0J9E874_9RHOB|nr:SGNH/GDSL hydrolase family protein [Candidatus Rhodobacter lobularis]KMW57964.1 GDSL-like lipase/acylhydrolase [Candidatus Rhodobacter lobularis]
MLRSIWSHTARAARLAMFIFIGVLLATLVRAEPMRVLAIGDSLMASHAISGRSVAGYLERELGVPVKDRSVLGAHMVYRLPISGAMGLSIPAQFRGEDWDWVVMTGGGNDLWLGCGCGRCDRRMNKLISKDGTRGKIPQLMAKILKSGARVIYVGYLRSPGINTPIEHCKDEGDALEARVADLAARVDGVYYLSLQDLVPSGDRSYFAIDLIHPSKKASARIAARVAALIKPSS